MPEKVIEVPREFTSPRTYRFTKTQLIRVKANLEAKLAEVTGWLSQFD